MGGLEDFLGYFDTLVTVDISDIIEIALKVFSYWYGNFTDLFDSLNGTVSNLVGNTLSALGVPDSVSIVFESALNVLFEDLYVLELFGVGAFIVLLTIIVIKIITILLDSLNFIS